MEEAQVVCGWWVFGVGDIGLAHLWQPCLNTESQQG